MSSPKRLFIVGGTGFLGYHTVMEFFQRGWQVTAFDLPPAQPKGLLPPGVNVVLSDLEKITDSEMIAMLRGYDLLIFAAGMDDRLTPSKPAYPKSIIPTSRFIYASWTWLVRQGGTAPWSLVLISLISTVSGHISAWLSTILTYAAGWNRNRSSHPSPI